MSEHGLLGYEWRVGDIGAERAARIPAPRWSIVGRDPAADWLDGPQVVLHVGPSNEAIGQEIATLVVQALNEAEKP